MRDKDLIIILIGLIIFVLVMGLSYAGVEIQGAGIGTSSYGAIQAVQIGE